MTTTTLTAITPASGHPPVIVSGADVVASVSANAWRSLVRMATLLGGLGPGR